MILDPFHCQTGHRTGHRTGCPDPFGRDFSKYRPLARVSDGSRLGLVMFLWSPVLRIAPSSRGQPTFVLFRYRSGFGSIYLEKTMVNAFGQKSLDFASKLMLSSRIESTMHRGIILSNTTGQRRSKARCPNRTTLVRSAPRGRRGAGLSRIRGSTF